MKKIVVVMAFALALNFLAVVGGAGYLWKSGHLNRERVDAIKAILFPPPATQPVMLAEGPTTQPVRPLDALLEKAAGLPAEAQVAFLQHSFDARMAQLDAYQRELTDQQGHIDQTRESLSSERAGRNDALRASQPGLTDFLGDSGLFIPWLQVELAPDSGCKLRLKQKRGDSRLTRSRSVNSLQSFSHRHPFSASAAFATRPPEPASQPSYPATGSR